MFDGYPTAVNICGEMFPVNTDFRVMCAFESAIVRSDTAKLTSVISDFFNGGIPRRVNAAVDAVTNFYLCGKRKDNAPAGGANNRRCYDFEEDKPYFVAAFRQQYGIDLIAAELHWWDFSALFSGLTEQTELIKIMQIRCTDVLKIENKKERARIKSLQSKYALSEYRAKRYKTVKERDEAMIEAAKKSIREAERNKRQ